MFRRRKYRAGRCGEQRPGVSFHKLDQSRGNSVVHCIGDRVEQRVHCCNVEQQYSGSRDDFDSGSCHCGRSWHCTIRATSTVNSAISGTATVEVTPLRSVTVTPNTTTIFTGEQRPLTANVQLEAGASQAVTWRTSASTIVAVSQAGVVTAVAPGTAIITAISVADTTLRGTASVTSHRVYVQ